VEGLQVGNKFIFHLVFGSSDGFKFKCQLAHLFIQVGDGLELFYVVCLNFDIAHEAFGGVKTLLNRSLELVSKVGKWFLQQLRDVLQKLFVVEHLFHFLENVVGLTDSSEFSDVFGGKINLFGF
jgi:hypothetical protein